MYSAAIVKVEKTIISYILYSTSYRANNSYHILSYTIPFMLRNKSLKELGDDLT